MPEAYRVRNWKEYNEALVKRGSVTLWFAEEFIQSWQAEKQPGVRGRPQKYSDSAIECGLTLKALFNLTFRMTEGFIKSLVTRLNLAIAVPDYSLLCKRQKNLKVAVINQRLKSTEAIAIVVDSSGLKVYGEGEWQVRQHGKKKHRLWRKLHIAVNSEEQTIEALQLTDLGVQDSEGFSLLMEAIKKPILSATGDGAYDRFSCYEESVQRDFELIVPAQRNAKLSEERKRNKPKASAKAKQKRDETIKKIRQLGRKEWKVSTRYHRRSLAETALYRVKRLLGNHLSTRKLAHQETESAIWCKIINKMTALGMPQTTKI